MSEKTHIFRVSPEHEGRIDKVLAALLPQYSRSRLQALIKEERVSVNGTKVIKTGHDINPGDEICISIPEVNQINLIAEDIPLDIIFDSSDLVIINKPAGMVVHPAPGHSSGTLVHAALGQFHDLEGIGGEMRPGIVHRLDKDTSGLIIIAKNDQAHRWLQDQFRLRKVEKVYMALVEGKPPTPVGRIEAAIARDPSHRKKMAIVSEGRGRASVTEYSTIKEYSKHTLLEAHPLTGRTHQIRLHMAFINCPIVGDKVYGRKSPTIELGRHFLHAARISIILPGEKEIKTFSARLPIDLEQVLNDLD